jgi:hypothetical protein
MMKRTPTVFGLLMALRANGIDISFLVLVDRNDVNVRKPLILFFSFKKSLVSILEKQKDKKMDRLFVFQCLIAFYIDTRLSDPNRKQNPYWDSLFVPRLSATLCRQYFDGL